MNKKKRNTKSKNEKILDIRITEDDLMYSNPKNDTRIKQVDGKTVLLIDSSTDSHRDAGLFFHFLTLSLMILTFAVGMGSAISTMLKISHNVLGISNALSMPVVLMFAGVGFLIGGNFWRKRKQHSFSIISISILILLLTNLLFFIAPESLILSTISGVQHDRFNPESIFAIVFSAIPFFLIFTLILGLFTSLMIPALSLVDIWHRERLRRKSHFTTPPKVRRWLALWLSPE